MPTTTQVPEGSALQLPQDFHRTPSTRSQPARFEFDLDPASGAAAAEIAAAFGILLYRYNAQASITLNASRKSASGELLWRRPLELSTGAQAHGKSVLEEARAFLRRVDDGSPAGWALSRAVGSRAAIAFLESDPAEEPLDQDDLLLALQPSDAKFRAAFLYDAGVFKRTSIERIAGHLKELLANLLASPDTPLSRLRLLPQAERLWIESVCEGAPRKTPAEFVHLSFERHAAASPETAAVRFRNEALSYRELNSRANRLARYLTAQGVGAESRVVVCLDPSFDVAIALLAILKAGAVYVPLDPTYPAARIRAVLEDIQPTLVLTRSHLREKTAGPVHAVLALDEAAALVGAYSDEDPGLAVDPRQTAYVYYTSGTTGTPKGAMASQANLASYIAAARERYRIAATDVIPAIARFSFSISMFELMSPLAAGGTLVLLERDHILDLARMAKTLEGVTFFHAGPSLLKNILPFIKRRYSDFQAFAGVRHASSGGDMVSAEVAEDLKLIFPNAEVFVIYGCSEISCMGTTYPVARERAIERTYVGRVFDGMVLRVLDGARNILPVGIVGEIHFAGDGIVKGYWNRPELTVEKFVEIDGRRFYRTGDMGRLSEDGWLEILGRGDFQIKLRGMRIELGEVEHHLRRAPGVRDGVVMAGNTEGETSLIAYLVMDRGEAIADLAPYSAAAVRSFMSEHLPDYMVPARYVQLDSLPLNHNMKVDRRALPAPEDANCRLDDVASLRAPRTATEKRLASIWGKLLGLRQIGLDDHFFDLGGHSLLGLKLILAVDAELGVTLDGMDVLRESLETQAALCDRHLGKPRVEVQSGDPSRAPEESFEAFHFGDGQSLYGVLSGCAAGEAVLICPPVGHELVRTHFILRQLAKRLAAKGVPSLRFDYYGCGDSLGEGADATCSRWRRDVVQAYDELKRRTGATRITCVGVRLGAALADAGASGLPVAGFVFWDPVRDGAAHLAEVSSTHDRFIRVLMRWRYQMPPPAEGGRELVGLVCSETNARELETIRLAPWRVRSRAPVKVFSSPDVDFDCGWTDVTRIDQILPDTGVSAKLASMVLER
ncbi:MAG: amino acid adenylation domain-containing protein [Elusimicrobia bacterium]|nr:amino acid adenylation domain-containing protein [Elusimicrobiota bacterium]